MNEISKNLMCVQMRSGVEVWLESDRATNLQTTLLNITGSKFIKIDDQIVNTADIVGLFNPKTMADHTHRKNGKWQCSFNTWHQKNDTCGCGQVPEHLRG